MQSSKIIENISMKLICNEKCVRFGILIVCVLLFKNITNQDFSLYCECLIRHGLKMDNLH